MMKQLKIWGWLSLICLTSLQCKKFLAVEPVNRLSIDDIFKDFEGARTTLVGIYDNLKSTNYYERIFSLYPELTGGNVKYARSNPTILVNSYNFRNTNQADFNDMAAFYQLGYNTIYRANNVIANITKVADANPQQLNRMLADAYTFRALAHFDLARVFAQPFTFSANGQHEGIVIRTQNTLATVPVEAPSTMAQVYTQVLSDLDSAILLYANSVPIYAGGTEKTWLSADAAKALKLRVHLYREDWQEVVALANGLTASAYPLVSHANYANSWRRSTTGNASMDAETIFMLFARVDQNQGSFGDNFNPGNTTFGYMAATQDVQSLFAPGDVRGPASMMAEATLSNINYRFTRKYQGRNDSANNQKLFRISEVILSRAEANAALGNTNAALTDLNRIRQRANPAAPALNITNNQLLLDSIFTERRRELCFEGHLLFDIARQRRPVQRTDCNATTCSVPFPSPLFAVPKPTQR